MKIKLKLEEKVFTEYESGYAPDVGEVVGYGLNKYKVIAKYPDEDGVVCELKPVKI